MSLATHATTGCPYEIPTLANIIEQVIESYFMTCATHGIFLYMVVTQCFGSILI